MNNKEGSKTDANRESLKRSSTEPWLKFASVIIALASLIIAAVVVLRSIAEDKNGSTQAPPPAVTEPLETTIPVPDKCQGKSVGDLEYFSVYPDYDPSGFMGDIGDIASVNKSSKGVQFTYQVAGRGPHEWDFKYVDGALNPNPAKFAGVMYLCCGWGDRPGFDLRDFRRAITWEARSLSGTVNVEFVIGGVVFVWDNEKKSKIKPPCPDTLRRKPLGIHTLDEMWQSFEVSLQDIPEEEFVNVIGGFAWVITWGSTGIEADETATPARPKVPKTFVIEIRNIRYER
jgi:hypothetical protein